MLNKLSLLLSLTVIILGASISGAFAQGAVVNLPGLNVDTSGGGVTVDMPGLNIDTRSGTTVNAPGVNIQTGTYGRNTRVRTPNVNIQTNRATSSGMSYVNADLIGMDFRNKYLVGADFTNANVMNADFSGADLRGAIFLNSNLTNTNFTNATMIGADFTNADFINTNLSFADLSNANLTNATIQGALATGTKFDGANLRNVDMSLFVRQRVSVRTPVAPRPTFTNAQMISTALTIDPRQPKVAKRIDLTINFALDSDMLSSAGARQVAEIAKAINSSNIRGSHIVLEGHTDSTGNAAYNQELSYRRAMRVLFTLRDQYQVPGSLLEAKGYGELRPIASNKSDIGRAMNRRVTVVNMGK